MLPSRFRNLPPRRIDQVVAATLFFLALALRLIGIGWGLPNDLHAQSYHPDEPINYAVSRQVSPAKLDFSTGFYNYGTLYFTVLRVAGDMAHAYGSVGDDPVRQASSGHLAGRLISAVSGAGTVLLVFLMLRRLTNRFGGILGSLLVAFAPAHVVHSRFQTPDVFACMLIAASLLYSILIVTSSDELDSQGPRPRDQAIGRWAIWAGVFAGLAAGAKYAGALAILPLFVALAVQGGPRWKSRALVGTFAMIFAFVVSTPGVLLESSKFLQDFTYELGHSASGHGLVFVGYGSGFAFQLTNLVLGVGLLLTALGVAGIFGAGFSGLRTRRTVEPKVEVDAEESSAVVGRQPWAWATLAFFVPYYFLIGRGEVFFMRYTFPLVVVLALGFGWLMGLAHHRKRHWLLVVVLGVVGLGGVDFGGFRQAATMTLWMASEDPRDSAARYLKEQSSLSPTSLVVGFASDPWFYTPPIYPETTLPRSVPAELRDQAMATAQNPRAAFVPFGPGDRSPWNLALLEQVRPDFVAFSSFEYADVNRLREVKGLAGDVQVHVDRASAFAEVLKREYRLERVFGKREVLVHDLEYIRPNIWIWKRRSTDSKTP